MGKSGLAGGVVRDTSFLKELSDADTSDAAIARWMNGCGRPENEAF